VLHGLDLPDLPVVTLEEEIGDLHTKFATVAPILDRHFGGAERARLDVLFGQAVPDGLRRLGTDVVACHGDLGPWNVILAVDGRVGVIDFGDVVRTDRSKDLGGLDDPVTLDRALAAYGRDDPALREKIAWRAAAALLMDLIFFAGKQDDARLAVCLDRVRRAAHMTPGPAGRAP
jgi:hypothetical protein